MSGRTAVFELLGSGTSNGLPAIACRCSACLSPDPLDKRMRCSGLLRLPDGENILIDCGPEVRLQLLRAGVTSITCVLITHSHADHVYGLDDLCQLACHGPIPVFANARSLGELRVSFDYLLQGSSPFDFREITGPFDICGIHIVPVPMGHGKLPTLGFRIGNIAYLTDANAFPDEARPILHGVQAIVIDALSKKSHPTHFSFADAMREIGLIRPERAWFTHIGHESTHADIIQWIAENRNGREELAGIEIAPSYDGLTIDVSLPDLQTDL
jgi:phosphoribosyl 1,2-cyclic phosphate phosphodiesterase